MVTRLRNPLLLVVALFVAVTVARVWVDDPAEGVAALYALPIAVAGANWSRRAAVLTAAVAFLIFAVGTLILGFELGPVGYVSRAILYVGAALIVGQYAHRAKRSEDFTTAVLDSIGEGVGVTDMDGRLVLFNRENRRVVGLPANAEIGPEEWAEHYRVTDPQSGEQFETEALPLVRALNGERVQDVKLVITPTGQEPRSVSVNAVPVVDRTGEQLGAVATLRDETERLRVEQERRSLASIVESSADAISTATLDGVILSWNAGAQRLYGYSADEAIGSNMNMLLPPELHGGGRNMLRLIGGGERIEEVEFDIVRKDGGRVPVSLTAAPVFDVESRIVAAASIVRDISERKAAEAEAERLKSQFFALVSHELRTPLTSIVGYADLLEEDEEAGELPEHGRRYIEIIRRNSARLDRLVQDLLLVAQVEAGTFGVEIGSADLAELARACVDESRPAAEEEGITLSLEAEELEPVAGDPIRIAQVLDNLVSNAIKFTHAGGRVRLRVAEAGDRCVIEVEDTGAGIEPDELEHLFDRFYRAGAASTGHIKGVGLGLAITKAIVEQHDGKIEIESEPGKGSTFRILLPNRRAGSEEDAPEGREQVGA